MTLSASFALRVMGYGFWADEGVDSQAVLPAGEFRGAPGTASHGLHGGKRVPGPLGVCARAVAGDARRDGAAKAADYWARADCGGISTGRGIQGDAANGGGCSVGRDDWDGG